MSSLRDAPYKGQVAFLQPVAQVTIYLKFCKVLVLFEVLHEIQWLSDPYRRPAAFSEEVLVIDADRYYPHGFPGLLRGHFGYSEDTLLDRKHASGGSVGALAVQRERYAVVQALYYLVKSIEIARYRVQSVSFSCYRQDSEVPQKSGCLRISEYVESGTECYRLFFRSSIISGSRRAAQ